MAVSPGFRDFVLERLGETVPVTSRAMFGGVLVYGPGGPIALLDDDRLYLKSDVETDARFQAAGMEAFRPYGDDRAMGYREVPGEMLEAPGQLEPWLRLALEASERGAARKRRR